MYKIAVASGKGGTGKSTVAAYTGMALAAVGKRTLLLELGADARSLDTITGAHEGAVFDLADVLAERCEPEKAVVPAGYGVNLFLLPAAPGAGERPKDAEQVKCLLKTLAGQYDYILADGVDFAVADPAAFDMILMVTTPDTLSVRACQDAVARLEAAGAHSIRLVINNVPPQIVPIYGARDFDDVIDQVGAQLIAVIPQSPKLHYSANNSAPLDRETATVQVFENLACRLRGQSRPLLIR